jgi:hypothetical protein
MAAEGGFYDSQLFDQLVGVDQAAEKALSGLEGRFGIVLNACVARLREHDFLRFLEPERRTLADMIAVQMIRTPETRVALRQLGQALVDNRSLLFPGGEWDRLDEQVGEAEARDLQIGLIFDEDVRRRLSGLLLKRLWLVVETNEAQIYTSDHPVVATGGWAIRGSEVFFPLTAQHLLVIVDEPSERWQHCVGTRASDAAKASIEYVNTLQVAQSFRRVFFVLDEFQFARELLLRDRDLANTERERITVIGPQDCRNGPDV